MSEQDKYPGPWAAEVAKASASDLRSLWAGWTSEQGLLSAMNHYKNTYQLDLSVDEIKKVLGEALNARKVQLAQPAPDPSRKQSTHERIDDAIMQHLAATDAYAVAVEQAARLDAEAKRLAARKYLEVKADVPENAKRVTDTEANRAVDADETVLEARLAADIAAAQTKAARARLDHWEHVIEFGRSVFARETRADTR